jgi:hypothetical protein
MNDHRMPYWCHVSVFFCFILFLVCSSRVEAGGTIILSGIDFIPTTETLLVGGTGYQHDAVIQGLSTSRVTFQAPIHFPKNAKKMKSVTFYGWDNNPNEYMFAGIYEVDITVDYGRDLCTIDTTTLSSGTTIQAIPGLNWLSENTIIKGKQYYVWISLYGDMGFSGVRIDY